jgi:multiple sugar transport system permease protein
VIPASTLRSALWYAASLALLVDFLFPIYWMVAVSLKAPEEIFRSPPIWFPRSPQLTSYRSLIADGDVRAIGNSIVIAGVSTIIAMALGIACAYGMVRYRTGGDNLRLWVLSQRFLPPIAIVLPVFFAYSYFGLSDSFPGLILLYTAFALPYVVWMMSGYLEEVPREIEESALVDGCSPLGVLWRIVVPIARNGIVATAIFAFIYSWNEFLFALVLTRTNVITYTVQISQYFGPQSTCWAKIAAMSVLGTLPVLLTVLFLQRYLARGISYGAVKG